KMVSAPRPTASTTVAIIISMRLNPRCPLPFRARDSVIFISDLTKSQPGPEIGPVAGVQPVLNASRRGYRYCFNASRGLRLKVSHISHRQEAAAAWQRGRVDVTTRGRHSRRQRAWQTAGA